MNYFLSITNQTHQIKQIKTNQTKMGQTLTNALNKVGLSQPKIQWPIIPVTLSQFLEMNRDAPFYQEIDHVYRDKQNMYIFSVTFITEKLDEHLRKTEAFVLDDDHHLKPYTDNVFLNYGYVITRIKIEYLLKMTPGPEGCIQEKQILFNVCQDMKDVQILKEKVTPPALFVKRAFIKYHGEFQPQLISTTSDLFELEKIDLALKITSDNKEYQSIKEKNPNVNLYIIYWREYYQCVACKRPFDY